MIGIQIEESEYFVRTPNGQETLRQRLHIAGGGVGLQIPARDAHHIIGVVLRQGGGTEDYQNDTVFALDEEFGDGGGLNLEILPCVLSQAMQIFVVISTEIKKYLRCLLFRPGFSPFLAGRCVRSGASLRSVVKEGERERRM